MKLHCSLVSLALMSFAVASGQQISTVKQTVTTIARGRTVSVATREVRVVQTPAPAKSRLGTVSSAVRLSTTGQSAGSVRTKTPVATLPVATLPVAKLPPTKKVHPNLFPGYPNATISSQSFGSTAVGGTSATITLSYPYPSGVTEQNFTFASGLNGFFGQATCNYPQPCTAPIAFQPSYPGLTTNAVISKDQNGNVIYETLLYATGTGPQFGFDLGATTIHNSVTSQPGSIAVGPDGSIYLTDASEDAVIEIASDFSSQSQLNIAGLGVTGGIAVDGAGTVYVADKTNNVVVAYNSQGGQATISTSALSNPSGLAVTGTGLLFIADTGNGRIIAIDNNGGETTVASDLSSPTSLAVDAAGDLFYADAGNGGEIIEIPVENNPVTIATQQGTLYDMAVDAAGRLYISTPGGDTLISPDGTIQEYGGGRNYGMALDQAGDVLFSQPANGSLLSNNRSVANFTLSTQAGTTTSGGNTISNTGNAALMISNISISGGSVFTDDDSDQCFAGLTLQPAQRCDTLVDFSPTAAQNYTESYTVTSNSLYVTTTTDVDTLNGDGLGVATTTALSISPSPATLGQGVTFTATVNQQGSDLPAPTGTVNFLDGTTVLGTGTISGNTAVYSTANLAGGTHSITAMYTGDTNNAPSTSPAQTLLVTAGNMSTTQLVSTPATPTAGQTVTFTVNVSGATQTTVATGTVTLTNAGATLATITLDNTGQGIFSTAYLAPGSYSLIANYSGDATYNPSTSGVDSFTVAAAAAPSFVSNIGTPLAAQSVGVFLAAAGTVQSVQVLTQGVAGLDFTMASSGTCATGTAYTAGQYCTVNVIFSPQHAGTRSGAVLLLDENANTLGVTYLQGSGTGPQIIYGAGTQTVLGGGLTSPEGLGLDGAGNVYVADLASGFVKEIPLGCASAACVKTLASGFMYPNGLVVDGAGNVFFDDFSNSNDSSSSTSDNLVEEIPLGCTSSSCIRTLGSGFILPDGIAVDLSGDIFVSDFGNNAVKELVAVNGVVPASPTINILAGGFTGQTGPDGLTLDASGNVYVTDHDDGHALYEIPFAGGYSTLNTISASFTAPEDITFDGTGNGYVVDEDTNSLYELPASGGTLPAPPTVTTLAADFNSPEGVAVDGLGNVYVSDYGNQRVVKIDYSDPTALNFATATTVGATDTADGPQQVTVRNNGNAALTFTAFVPSTNFTLDSETTTCSTTVALAAGSSCVVGVDFAPTAAGSLSGTLTLTDNARNVPGASQSIPLSGTGVAGSTPATSVTTLAITPAAPTVGQSVTFSVTVTGATPVATGTVTLMNTAVTPATTLGTITLGASGTGAFSTSTLSAGSYTVTALYSGDVNYAASTSAADAFTVSAPAAPTPITTMTTLAVTSGGSAVTTVASGSVVTLTAAVLAGTATVSPAQVAFCDAAALMCTGTHLLATAQVASTGAAAGTATYRFVPGLGAHNYLAMFLGTKTATQSASGASALLVTGKSPTTTTIAQSGTLGNYTLTATTIGPGLHPLPTATETMTINLGQSAQNYVLTGTGPSTYQGSTYGNYYNTQGACVTSGPITTCDLTGNFTSSASTFAAGTYDFQTVFSGSLSSAILSQTGSPVGTNEPNDFFYTVFAPSTTMTLKLSITGGGSFEVPVVINGNFAPGLDNLNFADVSPVCGGTSLGGDPCQQDYVGTVVGATYTSPITGTVQFELPSAPPAGPRGPTGSITFEDASNANAALGTAALSTPTSAFALAQPAVSPVAVGSGPYGIATGDFNGDGFQDAVVENYNDGTVSVLLGNGDGTFQPQVTYTVGSLPERVMVADLNGDGFLDLIVANSASKTIGVLLGNGNGTFQAMVSYSSGGTPVGLGIMDINHDGYPDVVVGDYYENLMGVLLGKGDGTLQPVVTYATGRTPQTVAEGDFNGDGNVDVVVGNEGGATVGIFLGNGDGTFQAQVTYPVGNLPMGVQVGDFNSDGKQDLAISNQSDGTVSVLLGNGDGTFQAQVTYPVGVQPVGLAVADFNGDGIEDISVGNTGQTSLTQSVLLGNGDGTFQPQLTFPAGNFPYGVGVADFNGDGLPDMVVANYIDGTATIFLSQVTQTATASANVMISGSSDDTHNVEANYLGDTNFSPSVSATTPLFGGAMTAASNTTLAITPAASTLGQSVTFSVVVAGTTQLTPVPTGTVTLMNGSALLGTITLGATGTGTFSTSALPKGSYSVVARYSGDTNYLASMSTAQTFVVSLDAQTITFGALGNQTYGGAPIMLAATASSLLAVSYAVTGPATVTGSTLTITGAGIVTVTASQAGNATYAAATAVSQSFTVAQAVLTATANNASRAYGAANPAFTYVVAGFVNGDTVAAVTGTATLTTTATTASDAGTYPIAFATKGLTAANYSFNYVAGTLTVVGDVAQTITFPAIPNHKAGDPPFTLAATASSGLAVSYAVTSGPATVAGGTVTLTGAGTVTIQASQAGNTDYAAATPVSQSFTVTGGAAPTLASLLPAGAVAGSAATTVTLTGTNFASTDVAQAGETALATTFVNTTTLTAVLPASVLVNAGSLPIAVTDSATNASSGTVNFAIAVAPAVVFTGPPAATSDQQPMVTFQLTQPYAVPIECVLTLTFAPLTAGGSGDPAVQFSTGGTTINFTIAAGSTTTPPVQFQTGTVAGTATVTLKILTADGANVTPAYILPVVVSLPATVPDISTATVSRVAGTASTDLLTVTMQGFSNTREVKTAIFHFTPVPGNTLTDPDVTIDVSGIFGDWFGSDASTQYGSTFTYTQPFNLNADPKTIQSVTVTLVNGVGNSVAQTTE